MRTQPWPIFVAIGALLVLLCMNATGVAVWDDAYIFWRYASHVPTEGRWNWNPGDASSYGVTSLAWTALLAVPTMFLNAPFGLWIASLLCGLGVMLLLWRLSRNSRWMFAWLLLANALPFAMHFTSGMDTAQVILYQLIWLSMLERGSSAALLGALAGFGWWVRPEVAGLLLLSLAIISVREGKYMGLVAGVSSLLIAVGCCWMAMGSAMPLPMFSKTGGTLDPGIKEVYAGEGWRQGALFLIAQVPVLLGLMWNRKGARETIHLWLPAVGLCMFYAIAVTHIMGMHQRFFYHAWPMLAMAGLHSLRDAQVQPRRGLLVTALAGCICILFTLMAGKPSSLLARWGVFGMEDVYRLQGGEYNWPLLPQVQLLPEDASIATSELGMAGAWNLQRPVIDLSSLTDPSQPSAEELARKVVLQHQPEVIWLHPHYTRQTNAFLSLPQFQRDYTWFSPEATGAYQGLALRNASPHFEFLRKEVEHYIALHP